jgi:hypothetical protein
MHFRQQKTHFLGLTDATAGSAFLFNNGFLERNNAFFDQNIAFLTLGSSLSTSLQSESKITYTGQQLSWIDCSIKARWRDCIGQAHWLLSKMRDPPPKYNRPNAMHTCAQHRGVHGEPCQRPEGIR